MSLLLQHDGIESVLVADFPDSRKYSFLGREVLVPTLEEYFSMHEMESGSGVDLILKGRDF